MLSLSRCSLHSSQPNRRRGQLAGTVTDASGAPLPGVTITLSGIERRTTVTNARGEFTFDESPPRRLRGSRGAGRIYNQTAKTTVIDGRTARVSLGMNVGSLAETVTVTGETPVLSAQESARRRHRAA